MLVDLFLFSFSAKGTGPLWIPVPTKLFHDSTMGEAETDHLRVPAEVCGVE